jgi:(4S)-4-hydroxy-5-phosphonooxypentane-2,3-dione isomerase
VRGIIARSPPGSNCARRLTGGFKEWEEDIMIIVHVHVHVKPEFVESFRLASMANARESTKEPGIARFDVLQQADDSTRFLLIEIYRAADDPGRHKQTAHYQVWRDTVENMMAEPRHSVKYTAVALADL